MRYKLSLFVFFTLMLGSTYIQAVENPVPEASQNVIDFWVLMTSDYGNKLYVSTDGNVQPAGSNIMGDANHDTVVLYVNGVGNTLEDFKRSVLALRGVLPPSLGDAPIYGFYNMSATNKTSVIAKYTCPLLKASFLKSNQLEQACIKGYGNLGMISDGLEAAGQMLDARIFQDKSFISSTAVTTLKEALRNTVLAGRRVIIVAHSQGNLFVRAALRDLIAHNESFGYRLSASIGVVMVGSPVKVSSVPGYTLSKYRPNGTYMAEDLCSDTMASSGLFFCDTRGYVAKAWIGHCSDPVAQLGMERTYQMTPDLGIADLLRFVVLAFSTTANYIQFIGGQTFEMVNSVNKLNSILVDVLGTQMTLKEMPFKYAWCQNDSMRWDFDSHLFIDSYLTGYTLNVIKQVIADIGKELPYLSQVFMSGDHVIATDNLNVRKGRWADPYFSNLLYTANVGSVGTIDDDGMLKDGYFWYHVCFDGQGCGYVASNWLDFDFSRPQYLDQGLLGTVDTFMPTETQVLEKTPTTNILTVAGGLTLPVPDGNDAIDGMGGCRECSTSAPERFEMSEGAIFCSSTNTGGNVTVNWQPAFGATSYNVYRDSELAAEGLLTTSYTDTTELELGTTHLYFVKALNADGSRNADTSWYPEIPATLCGAPEPPPPYTGPVPSVATMEISELSAIGARMHGNANPNGVPLNSFFEYGLSEDNLAFSTNSISQGMGTDSVSFSYPASGLNCGTVYYYRAAGEYYGNAVTVAYGDTLSFTTPECVSSAPSNLAIRHDVKNDALVLTWDEPVIPHTSFVKVERKVVSDPRPGMDMNGWSYNGTQDPEHETFSDTWLSPQPGSEYCYRIRTLNPLVGDAGYSEYSNEVCIVIEGVFVQQVDFPLGPWPLSTPGIGIDVDAPGGIGVFNIERRTATSGYVVVGSADAGMQVGFNWMDTNVVGGETYCYRFEQYGQKSAEACVMYADVDTIGTPVLLSLTATDSFISNGVLLEWTSRVPDQGAFEIERYGKREDGSTGWFRDRIVSETSAETVRKRYPEDTTVCFRINQINNGVYSDHSNAECISDGETSTIVDIKPVITLTGGDVVIDQGSSYVDPGYTATDYLSRNISGSVIVSGLVNTSMIGVYHLSYSVTDSEGNVALPLTRRVEVLPPNMAPEIVLRGASIYTISRGEVFADPGYRATDDRDGDVSTSVLVSGVVDTATAGVYTVSYYVEDSSGFSATELRVVYVLGIDEPLPSSFLTLPDLNGNGAPEIAIAVDESEAGFVVRVFDSSNNELLHTITP